MHMYEKGARVKEVAAYIGDLESTTECYYIAIRKKSQMMESTASCAAAYGFKVGWSSSVGSGELARCEQ